MLRIVADTSQLRPLAARLAALGGNVDRGIARGLNVNMRRAVTAMKRVLPQQTGLKRGVFDRAMKASPASAAHLVVVVRAHGGDVSLKYFKARETRSGVSAAPWNERRVYPGSFMKGGRFPNRVPLKMGGQVFKRVGTARKPIEKQKSGLFIPIEMTSKQAASAFQVVVSSRLVVDVARELGAILSGAAPA